MTLGAEQAEHINIVNWFNYEFPELSEDLHHFANERKCSIQQGRTLKRMGVKKGVADFFLAFPIGDYSGLWIELKVGKGKLSIEQSKFLFRKNERGYLSIAVWGFEAAKEVILNYLKEYIITKSLIEQKNLYNGKPIC